MTADVRKLLEQILESQPTNWHPKQRASAILHALSEAGIELIETDRLDKMTSEARDIHNGAADKRVLQLRLHGPV